MGSCISVEETTGEIRCGPSVRAKMKEKRRVALEFLAAETKAAELLNQIPGRMHVNGATSAACLFTQQGRKGRNQDTMIVWENFASRTDIIFCGVFDGHGPYGHLVARRVRDSLPSKLMAKWKARLLDDGADSGFEEEDWKESADHGFHNDAKAPEMINAWKYSLLKAYHLMDKELRIHPKVNCFCSGATAVTMLLQGKDLLIGNVGDSRAVLGRRREDNSMEAIQLTIDLKPNLPREAERIKRRRGRVFALEDEPDVARVWLPHCDSPGLSMARALGDFCLKDFGLIAVPELSYTRLTARDEFVVLASDGVWDVISNEEAVEVIQKATTKASAARALVKRAVAKWRKKYAPSRVDDCSVVCLYLNNNNDNTHNLGFSHDSISPPLRHAMTTQSGECVPFGGDEKSRPLLMVSTKA